jgi:outer membrane protein assembly factor BamB
MSTRENIASRALAAAALLALAAAAGCGGEGDGGEPRADRQSSEARREAEEPPPATAFATEAAFTLDTGPVRYPPVALHGRNAWVADGTGLALVDLDTGDEVTRLDPARQPLQEPDGSDGRRDEAEARELEQQGAQRRLPRPLLTRIGGAPAVVAAVPVQGKRQDVAVEILAANAETGKRLWNLPVEPVVLADEKSAANLSAPVLHAHDGTAVVQVAKGDRMLGSLGVDLDEPRLLREQEDFLALAGSGDALAGMSFLDDDRIRLLGTTLADGERTWAEDLSKYASIAPCGPWLAFEDFDDDKGPRLIEVDGGDVTHTRDDGLVSGMSCWEGEGGTTAVLASNDEKGKGDEEQGGAIGLDTASGEVLWQLPPGEWEGEISAAYEDRLYLKTGNGLTVRNARTGEVLGKAPGIAPQQVNGYVGLIATGDGVEVHPAER